MDNEYKTLEQWFYNELSIDEYNCISKIFGRTTAFPIGVEHNLKAYQFILQNPC